MIDHIIYRSQTPEPDETGWFYAQDTKTPGDDIHPVKVIVYANGSKVVWLHDEQHATDGFRFFGPVPVVKEG